MLEGEKSEFVMIPNRIVLDTNVCLDLFVFRDQGCAALGKALRDGRLHAVTRSDCRREWEIVLGFPQLSLDSDSRRQATEEFDALIDCLPPAEMPAHTASLPICKDKADQKFLEAARDAHAFLLITKDKALLKLSKRTARAGMFRILTPQGATAELRDNETHQTALRTSSP